MERTDLAQDVAAADRADRRRILVADDNATSRRVAARQLALRGHDVEAVASGREALERLARAPFDLVFLDNAMPGLDGPATAREIRRREAAARAPRVAIVALTGSALPEDRDRMLEAGMDDLVGKPVARGELDAALARWLPARGGRRRAPILPAADQPADLVDEAALVDEATLARLADLGDPALVTRIVRVLLADAALRVAQAEAAAAAGDVARLADALEALESVAASLGAPALRRRARELGDATRASSSVAAPAGLAALCAVTGQRVLGLVAPARPA